MARKSNIYLVGYMGSGKSVVAKQLGKALNRKVLDLDTELEVRINMSISEYFEMYGEVEFRKVEYKTLVELRATSENIIFSLGGGTFCNDLVLDLLKEEITVYLQCSIQNLTDRLWKGKGKRPLISNLDYKNQLYKFIRSHLSDRKSFYKQATIVVRNNKDLKFVTQQILRKLPKE